MVTTPDPNRNNDELDLLELLLKTFIAIRERIWIILLLFVLGCSLGVMYFVLAKKEYESKMIISSNILTTSYAKILFDNANIHLREADFDILAKDLEIDAAEAKKIASLKIENLSKNDDGELKESDRYLITAYVYDQSVLPVLQKGLINYLERNDFVKVRVEQQRNFYNQMLVSTEKEIQDMEEFKSEVYSGRFFNNIKGNVMFDPTVVNSKILDLSQKRIEYKNALELINSVQLIDGFTVFKNYKKPTLITSVGVGIGLGLFAVAVLLGIVFIRRLLKMAKS